MFAQTDQDDVIRTETDVTNLPFTAMDKERRFVTTLKAEDLRVLEDGVPQQLFTFQRETDRPLAIAFRWTHPVVEPGGWRGWTIDSDCKRFPPALAGITLQHRKPAIQTNACTFEFVFQLISVHDVASMLLAEESQDLIRRSPSPNIHPIL